MLSPGLERFRDVMEADAALQERLNQPDDPALFIASVVSSARDHGIDLDASHIAAALGSGRQLASATSADGEARMPPGGWLPVRTQWREQKLWADWAYVGAGPFREPFFEQSVVRWRSKPFNRLFPYTTPVDCTTPIDMLADAQRQRSHRAPTGFIFHMSRCGSTLVSQMLAASARHIVISEAEPIDTVVQARRSRPGLTEEEQIEMLRSVVGALGQMRSGKEQHFFIKLDSWHAMALPLFRRAFPSTPWIFLYREPVEILVSQSRKRGLHMVPGLLGDVFDEKLSETAPNLEAYCGHVLARIGESVLKNYIGGQGLLINYRDLPEAVWADVLPHFGVSCSAVDRAAMAEVGQYDAKSPELRFADDSVEKRKAATPAIQAAAEQLRSLHARLEALRLRPTRTVRSQHIIEIASPAGMLRLRPEQDADDAFRFMLFCQSRPTDLALPTIEPAAREQLMRIQYRGQTMSYRANFPAAHFDIIELEGAAIGRLVADRAGNDIAIVDWAITQEMRGRGIGTAIMQAIVKEARQATRQIRLKVMSGNAAALQLYLRLGFAPVGTIASHTELVWSADRSREE